MCKYKNSIYIKGGEMRKNLMKKIIIAILSNYTNDKFDLKYILKTVNCNKNYVYKYCKEIFNSGVVELVETIRIHIALSLIFDDEFKVWSKTGYKSSAVFSKVFKKRTGMTVQQLKSDLFYKENEDMSKKIYCELLEKLWKGKYIVFNDICEYIVQESIDNYNYNINKEDLVKIILEYVTKTKYIK
jgi:AraC-like DNA-binding protein